MKKLLLLILLLFISTSAFAAITNERKEAVNRMNDSHRKLHELCINAADNFRLDHQFAGYLKYHCMMYESDRNRLLTSVFTVSSGLTSDERTNYPVLMSDFAIKINNNEFERYKAIITEYCKYNAYKYVKKEAGACSAARLNSLFSN